MRKILLQEKRRQINMPCTTRYTMHVFYETWFIVMVTRCFYSPSYDKILKGLSPGDPMHSEFFCPNTPVSVHQGLIRYMITEKSTYGFHLCLCVA